MSFPHSVICQLQLFSGTSYGWGTGFYIGPDKILSCGHNFMLGGRGTDPVRGVPGASPTMSTFEAREFPVVATDLVHPRWAATAPSGYAAADKAYDLSVLRVPGFLAPNGAYFTLTNRSLGANEGIVVAGYGKVDVATGGPYESQPQRMDGARIAEATTDLLDYPIQTAGGHSGSPGVPPIGRAAGRERG